MHTIVSILNRVPLEIILQILSLLPLDSFIAVYQVFPRSVVDEALRTRLYRYHHKDNMQQQHLLKLVSTNLCELSSPNSMSNIEAWIPLELAVVDLKHRWVWLHPDLRQYYFRVEDAYVSHGKLVIQHREKRRTLSSLWDIRKQLPPTRAGTFSGASEFAAQIQQTKEMTIADHNVILDACLVSPALAGYSYDQDVLFAPELTHQKKQPPRPPLRAGYTRQTPPREWSVRNPCGYFLVERVALSIQTFLELCTES